MSTLGPTEGSRRNSAVQKTETPRTPGSAKGKIWIAPDFDAPLPDELLDAFEGNEPDCLNLTKYTSSDQSPERDAPAP